MKIWPYNSYNQYVQEQIKANKRKLFRVWADSEVLYKIKKYKEDAQYILCHGVRNGEELNIFSAIYNPEVILGTEISPTADRFENTVQHDFHNERVDWVNKFDIVYTNSFDHAYNPNKCINVWKKQLREEGILVIEKTVGRHNKSKPSDPLEISDEEFKELITAKNLFIVGTEIGKIIKERELSIVDTESGKIVKGKELGSILYILKLKDYII